MIKKTLIFSFILTMFVTVFYISSNVKEREAKNNSVNMFNQKSHKEKINKEIVANYNKVDRADVIYESLFKIIVVLYENEKLSNREIDSVKNMISRNYIGISSNEVSVVNDKESK